MDVEPKRYVFVVDDDPKILRLVADVLEAEGWIVESYSLASEFLNSYRRESCACLLLDIQMPALNGPQLQRELLARDIRIPIIFLTATADVPTTIEVMKQGAVDLLQKPFDPEKLVEVVRNALAREAASVEQRMEVDAIRKKLAQLTPREREVLDLVVAGNANKQIARELNLSERTVEIHRGRVMKKMGADSVANLVHQCVSAGVTTRKSSS